MPFDPIFVSSSIVILLFSVIVHEVMHGFVALKFGDHTAERAGRLTLNPIPHIDLIGTILLPAMLILTRSPIMVGWAKPVPVNPLHFSDIKKGEFLVSIAGLLSNLGMAVVAAVLFHLINAFLAGEPTISSTLNLILNLLEFAVDINLLLAVFNLLPIPPLDGSKALLSQLPYNLARQYQKLEPYSFIFLIMLWIIPVGNTSLLFFILKTVTSLLKTVLGFNF